MGKAIMVVSGKGGTGKSTVVCGVGASLARAGASVVCLDFDVELRSLDIALGLSDRAAVDFYDVLERGVDLSGALIAHPALEKLSLLCAPVGISPAAIDAQKLALLVGRLCVRFEYCLIDCPSGLGACFELACLAAGSALIVATPDHISLRDAQRVNIELLERGIEDTRLILNRVRPHLMRGGAAVNVDDAIDTAGARLIGVIPEDERIIESLSRGGIADIAAASGAGQAFYNIAQRLRGRELPLMRQRRMQ